MKTQGQIIEELLRRIRVRDRIMAKSQRVDGLILNTLEASSSDRDIQRVIRVLRQKRKMFDVETNPCLRRERRLA
jgi:hypothetical protein